MSKNFNYLYGFVLILFSALIIAGCEQKKEEAPAGDNQSKPAETQTQDQLAVPETTAANTEKPEESQLVGEWKGNFGERRMTLTITSQDGNNFEGETVVRWDSPKKEKITGEFNPDTREFKIKETAGTRNNGNYTGTVTADLKTFTGVWKDNGNRKTFNISLTKQ